MLTDRVTGAQREVDVVIRSKVEGREVVVSVEAADRTRKADVEWVEQLIGKHRDLSTDTLALVSQAGFGPAALIKARHYNAVPLTPEDLDADDPALRRDRRAYDPCGRRS